MRRILLVLLAVIVLLGLVLALLREPISLRLMDRVLAATMASDPIAEREDGLHVILCGAGGPLPDPVRSGPCVAVVAGGRLFVVDAGSGGARNMQQQQLPPGQIEALLLTHFHSDHIDGLGELSLQRWAGGARDEPLPVYGPTGVSEVIDGFNAAYRQDVGYRVAHHGVDTVPPSGAGMQARPFREPAPGQAFTVLDDRGLEITSFKVEHEPVSPAVGYRFDYGGRSVLISGDTKKSRNLAEQARDVDLLVHEALSARLVGRIHQAAVTAGRVNLAKITSDIPDYHTTPIEVAEIAEGAGAGHLLYYHVVPPLPLPGLESAFLEGVSDAYSGDVTVGRDGTAFFLPPDSDAIEVR